MTKYDSYTLTHPGRPTNKGSWEHRIWAAVSAANNTIIPRYRHSELDPVSPTRDKLSIPRVRALSHDRCGDCFADLTPDTASLKYRLHPALGGDNHITNVYWVCRGCNKPPAKFKITYDSRGGTIVMPSDDFRIAFRKGLVTLHNGRWECR